MSSAFALAIIAVLIFIVFFALCAYYLRVIAPPPSARKPKPFLHRVKPTVNRNRKWMKWLQR